MANMQDNGTNWLFGQYGSALLDLHENESSQALYLFPPKGMVVVAITALYDTTFKASWVDLLQLVLITVIGAYFGGRSLEKVKK